MRYLPYPQSCGARTIVEFGNTAIGFGSEKTEPAELNDFLVSTRKQMVKEKNTFCTAVLNNDQVKLFHQTMIDNGWACIQKNRYHPKYGRSVSFYLLTLDWGPNKNYADLDNDAGENFVVTP
jgi:hypothetical protein